MALSQKARGRQSQIIEWIIEQVDSRAWKVLPKGGDQRRPEPGEVTRRRVWMIGRQALVEPVASSSSHILDVDNYWKIFKREMKLDSRVFYTTADMNHPGWGSIAYGRDPINSRPGIDQRFYKCLIRNYGQDSEVWVPELVDDFPAFTAVSLNDLWGRFCIGGKIDDLSSDSSLRRLSVNLFHGTQNVTTTRPGVFDYATSVSGSGLVGRVVTLTGESTNRHARVIIGGNVRLDLGDNILTIKCIAEDDTESTYTLTVTVRA